MIRAIRRLLGFESNSEKVSTLFDIDSRLGEISTEISELAHNYTRRYEAKNEVLKSMSDDFIVTEVTTRFDLFEKSHLNELLPLKKEKDALEYERLSLLKSKEVSELYRERQKFNIIKSKYKSGEIPTELYNIALKAKEGKVRYSDILVFNKSGELLILKRAKTDESQPEKWGLPGGHVDLGESHLIASKRELLEETGLNINESELTNIGKFEDKDVCIEYFKAIDVCIESNPIILQSEEHWDYKWINVSELDNYDMPFNMKDNIKKVLGIEEIEKKTIKSGTNDFKAFIEPFLKAFNEGEISAEVLKNVIEKAKMQKIEVNKQLIEKSVQAFRQGIILESSLKNIIEKARSGRYADTPENRRLKRVGREYGTKGKEDKKDTKDKKQDELPKDKQTAGDLTEQAKNSSVAQLEAAIKESPSPEVRQAAHTELDRREKEEKPQSNENKKIGEDYGNGDKATDKKDDKPESKDSEGKQVEAQKDSGAEKVEDDFKDIINKLSDKDIENIKNFGETEIQIIKNLGLNNDIVNEVGGIKNIDIHYSNYLNSLIINIDFGKGKMERKFYDKKEETKFSKMRNPSVFNSELKLDKSIQGKGIGTKIFNNQLSSLKEQGKYSKIETEASNGEETGEKLNGHYTWAKLGFKMFLPKDKNIFDDLINNNNRGEKNLEELMSTDKGRDFWKKNGFTYRGVVDLGNKEDSNKIQKSEEQDIEKANNLKGGLADELSINDIAKKHKVDIKQIKEQVKKGISVEMEHTDEPSEALEITLDHLTESPVYYDELEKMEKKFDKDKKDTKDE